MKARDSGEDFQMALLNWRNTPSGGFTSSAAQRLMSRRTKTQLTLSKSLLEPKVDKTVTQSLQKEKEK